jgi:molybdate transport system substrate-binding protein
MAPRDHQMSGACAFITSAYRSLPSGWWFAAVAGLAASCQSRPPAEGRGELVVFAASSLTDAFHELERGFETQNQGVDVRLTFAGSQVLRLQLEQGAAGDVFASANEDHMRALRDSGIVEPASLLAQNDLVVVVPLDNPARIESFVDLPRSERLVIGSEAVPVGYYARQVLTKASERLGVSFRVVSEESNVRLVRAKVELGEADAAIVYRTDATSSKAVKSIEIPSEFNVRVNYPIAVVSRSPRAAMARRFVTFALSETGQSAMAHHGFARVKP